MIAIEEEEEGIWCVKNEQGAFFYFYEDDNGLLIDVNEVKIKSTTEDRKLQILVNNTR